MKLKHLILILILFCSTTIIIHAEEHRCLLLREAGPWGDYFWWVSSTNAAKLPKWNSYKEPPLSPGKAIAIASKWFKTNKYYFRLAGAPDLERIQINPIQPESGKYHDVFCYIITISVGPVGNGATCVVLMDGTVVEPEVKPFEEPKSAEQKDK